MTVAFVPMTLLIDGDTEGRLALLEGKLAAIFVRLDGDAHPSEHQGCWHLEAGLGPCSFVRPRNPVFKTLSEAAAWVEQCAAKTTGRSPDTVAA